MNNYRQKFKIFTSGFTLAEVLITLVIVGVVAALTISPLINTYVESSTVAKVKKGLSILGQAKKLAEVQHGSIEGWDFGNSNSTFWSYLKPHISVVKDCGSGTACYQSDGVYQLNGFLYSTNNYNISTNYYKLVLSDGSVMWFRTNYSATCSNPDGDIQNVCAVFWYDVNGDKKPNTFGKDIFLYEMAIDGVYPNLTVCNNYSIGFGC